MSKYELERCILSAFLPHGIALPVALKTLTDCQSYVKSTITKLKKAGLIADRRRTIKTSQHSYSVRYLELRPSALDWLKQYGDVEWLEYLPCPMPPYTMTAEFSNEKLIRLLKSITASIMFAQLNIQTWIEPYSKECVPASFYDVICSVIDRYKNMNELCADNNICSGKDMYFHSYSINEHFKLSKSEIQQYKFSNHIGILVRRSKSYLVYSTMPQGLRFRPGAVLRTRSYAASFLARNRLTQEMNSCVQTGIILCSNPKEFKKTFDVNYNSALSDPNYRFTMLFEKIYAIPVCREGLYMLDNIFYYNNNLNNELISKLTAGSPEYSRGTTSMYPLKYNGCNTYIGIDMELGGLQRLIKDAAFINNKDIACYILCYEWQVDYYSRILPANIVIKTIEDDVLYT